MKNIFIGFIFLFVNLNLTLGELKIGLLPDFVGYIIMLNGLIELEEKSPLFMEASPYTKGMAFYSGILYFIDIMNFSASLGPLSYILMFPSTIVSLYISYKIILGVLDIEKTYSVMLRGTRLKSTWTILAVLDVMGLLTTYITGLALLFILCAFVATICFLIEFNKSKNLYYAAFRSNDNTSNTGAL